jgi:hypothetical protein
MVFFPFYLYKDAKIYPNYTKHIHKDCHKEVVTGVVTPSGRRK